ncbi:hypothetical protein ARAM_006154 [Aspergillus rambellii]|uniref:Dystroglycan-type cadherin-like domain-containing protein n=1 Tax=Aspergillus rambellii TaxID=308745 RepID=A0A0F8WDF6_9EURO|nr:hypothetical protein ARAM_006154 [Aspergillus rambellii]
MALLALILLSLLLTVNANLVSNYPVNSQLPPVARVSRPFRFTFSQTTFGGSSSETTYRLSNAPSWLEVDSKSRTLSGTPHKEDVGSPTFDLIASDQSGSASMQVTLIVTTDDGPKLGKPVLSQLEDIGPMSSPSSIIVRSGDSFSISFETDTFTNTRLSTVYYGTSPENAPLPSWIAFDQSSLRFYGTTPSIGPQTFSFNLVASDVAGFSAATVNFEITVSAHILSFNPSAETLFVTEGKEIRSPQFIDSLTLDGHKPTSNELVDINIDAPGWLTVNKQSLSFSGTPPTDGKNENVTISVKDNYQDVATLVVAMRYSQFFHDEIKECDAVIGQYFMFVFNSSVLTDSSAELDVDLGKDLPWLKYNRDNKTLYGQVPSDLHPDKTTIELTAHEGTAQDKRSVTIRTITGDGLQGQGIGDAGPGSDGYHRKKAGIILMAIFIPLGCLSIVLLFLYCRRRAKGRTGAEDAQGFEEKALPPPPLPPTGCLSHCQPFEETKRGQPPTMGMASPPVSKPPKLELEPWWNVHSDEASGHGQDPIDKDNTFSSSTIDWGFAPLRVSEIPEQDENKPPEEERPEAFVKSTRLSCPTSPPVRRRTSANSARREPLKPIQARRSLKRNSALSSRSKRWSKRSSGISTIASGLPVRLSGAGHGAGGLGPPGHGVVRISWQNTQASLRSDESSLGNLAPLFPRPPLRTRESQEYTKRVSLRTVDRDSLTISESDSLAAFVQGRAKSRNSSNPMFAGQTGRRVSSGLRALERARSTGSRADTINSSVYPENCRRQSSVSQAERPWSLALSGSIYTDDNRHSSYLRALSEESPNIRPLAAVMMAKGQSQSSLAQNYSSMIAPLPRFMSELSLAHIRRDDAGEVYGDSPLYGDESHNFFGRRRWSRSSPSLIKEGTWIPIASSQLLRKSPSTSSIPSDSKTRRVSLIRQAERESNYPRSFQRDLTGSGTSDIAFV